MEASNLYYGYIYKITIPTSEGICYYWGQHKYSNYPNIDLKYWGSGTKLTNWIKKHLGKQKRPGRLDPNLAIQIGLKREILGWYKSLEELNKAELNIIFESIQKATEYFKASHSHISDCCNKKRNTWKGYHWEYVEN